MQPGRVRGFGKALGAGAGVLGWLMGLLGGPIAEAIRRKRRRVELTNAIHAELRECRYLMASLASRLKSQNGDIDQAFLDWLLPLEREEAGVTGDAEPLNATLALREAALAGHPDLRVNRVTQGVSLNLKTYSLPLLNSSIPDLVLVPPGQRREMLAIFEQLSLLNQDVPFLMDHHARTFDSSLHAANHAAITQEIENGYRTMAGRAQRIADRISGVIGRPK